MGVVCAVSKICAGQPWEGTWNHLEISCLRAGLGKSTGVSSAGHKYQQGPLWSAVEEVLHPAGKTLAKAGQVGMGRSLEVHVGVWVRC